MSDSIGGPSGPKTTPFANSGGSSPFSRLQAKKVGAEGDNAPEPRVRPQIFRPVEARGDAVAQSRIAGLDAAVRNTVEASKSLQDIGRFSSEVADSNIRATELASIKDVDKAVALAAKIATDLTANRDLFEAAQAAGLKTSAVAEVLQPPLEQDRIT